MKSFTSVLLFAAVAEASLRLPAGYSSNTDFAITAPKDITSIERREAPPAPGKKCRFVPGDKEFPTQKDWDALNRTVDGRLIEGTPLGSLCRGSNMNDNVCSDLQKSWTSVDPYLSDPVNVMSPFWQNNTCSPWGGANGACASGNMAAYAINIGSPNHIVAGLKFAEKHNIRLVIKNTGHDHMGRSSGSGSLALWTHNLKDVSVIENYQSAEYRGPAMRVGAGVQVLEAYRASSAAGLRVAAGGCPTVGVAGWAQGGGHGPLTGAHGIGSDNVLEYDVITAQGQRLKATRNTNADLFRALAGGGAGNYAVVVSLTVRAQRDTPVAGASLLFANTDATTYWAAVSAWLRTMMRIEADFPALRTAVTFTGQFFFLDWATMPDPAGDGAALALALAPFRAELARLNVTLLQDDVRVTPTFLAHYEHFSGARPWGTNQTLGNRLIPRDFVRDRMGDFVGAVRAIAEETPGAIFVFASAPPPRAADKGVAVLPAWRDALLLLNFGLELSPDAGLAELRDHQAVVNSWQDRFRTLTPVAGGGYLNEGTWDNAAWKTDYFGANYNALAAAKNRYDPGHLLWARAAVASDQIWVEAADGRLCRR